MTREYYEKVLGQRGLRTYMKGVINGILVDGIFYNDGGGVLYCLAGKTGFRSKYITCGILVDMRAFYSWFSSIGKAPNRFILDHDL